MLTTAAVHGKQTFSIPPQTGLQPVAVSDSLTNDTDDDEEVNDSLGKSRLNRAKEFNALKYIMEGRYRNHGDQFTRRWDDHLFLEVGAGVHQEVAKHQGHPLSSMGTLHLAVGKQFNRLHTARLSFGADLGYRQDLETDFNRLSASADWIFSMSSYLNGYNPARLLDVSTVLGAGMRHIISGGETASRTSGEMHAGLQFRFFTGPQGYLVVEPYAGVASGSIVKKFNAFYGANLNFVYYIHNNLSPEQRLRYMRNKPAEADSTWQPGTWRTPWFMEAGGGLAKISGGSGMGHTMSASVGKWLSPAIGVRFGAQLTTTTYGQQLRAYNVGTERQEYIYNNHNHNLDLRLEALVNPMGFLKSFSWDAPFGGYVVLGGGVGRIAKNHAERYTAEQLAAAQQSNTTLPEQRLRTTTTFYSAGVNLWYRLTDDVKLFVEPKMTYYSYHIPYTNVSWAKRYSDNVLTVNFGLNATVTPMRLRHAESQQEEKKETVSVGGGIGTSLLHSQNSYSDSKTNLNYNAFAEYHFDHISSVRVSMEYMTVNGMSQLPVRYFDGFGTEWNDKNRQNVGMFHHQYNLMTIALNYMVNVPRLFSGTRKPRLFDVDLFAGPALLFKLNSKHEIAIANAPDYELSLTDKKNNIFCMNGGFKLKCNVAPHVALTLTPQLWVMTKRPELEGVEINKLRLAETLDFGVQLTL